MATTLEEVAKILEANKAKFEKNNETNSLALLLNLEGYNLVMFIHLENNNSVVNIDFFIYCKNDFLGIEKCPNKPLLMQKLLNLNSTYNQGAWGLTEEGKIIFATRTALGDNSLTSKQLDSMLHAGVQIVRSSAEMIMHIVEYGEIPNKTETVKMSADEKALWEEFKRFKKLKEDSAI